MNRPTLDELDWNAEQIDQLHAYFMSEEGRAHLSALRRCVVIEPNKVADCELSNETPPDTAFPRTIFNAPLPMARRVSWWPFIIAAFVATTACAILIGWFVAAAMEMPT